MKKIISIKYDVANNQLDKFDQYKQDIDTFYDNIMEKTADAGTVTFIAITGYES